MDNWDEYIYDERGFPIYDAVGADYKVVLGTGQICW